MGLNTTTPEGTFVNGDLDIDCAFYISVLACRFSHENL